MDLRNQVKQVLRHFGHAIVSTIHDRLNGLEMQLNNLTVQTAGINESQTALLQSSIYVVETLKEIQSGLERQHEDMERTLQQLVKAQDEIRAERVAGRTATSEQSRAALLAQNALLQQGFEQVGAFQDQVRNILDQEVVRQVCVESPDYGAVNPETGLMEYLFSFLPSRKVIDVGAHVGDVVERLLQAGYEVFAFEPFPPSFQALAARFAKRALEARFHPHNFALGSVDGDLVLHLAQDLSSSNRYADATAFNSLAVHSMPDDLPFVKSVVVPVRRLADLHRGGLIPSDVCMVKIDTEGYDLEVIRGMEDLRYPVVMAEYWDREIPFGKTGLLYTLDTLIAEMKARGYAWHIVIYRIWGRNQRAFYCNHSHPVPQSWGNAIFFQTYDLFAQAQTWCSATLPRTFFTTAQPGLKRL